MPIIKETLASCRTWAAKVTVITAIGNEVRAVFFDFSRPFLKWIVVAEETTIIRENSTQLRYARYCSRLPVLLRAEPVSIIVPQMHEFLMFTMALFMGGICLVMVCMTLLAGIDV